VFFHESQFPIAGKSLITYFSSVDDEKPMDQRKEQL